MQTELTLIPVGGLANRMKAIDAALALTGTNHARLRIIWFKDPGLNCRFDQLFEPFSRPDVEVREASLTDVLCLDRPRRKNFYLPRLFQSLRFDDCIYEEAATRLFYRRFDFSAWLRKQQRAYLASCVYFHPHDGALFRSFRPLPSLRQQVDGRCTPFGHTWGVHIRRTDNVASIAQSPTELFVRRMEEEIRKDDRCTFYLATDSEADKAALQARFGERIFTSHRPAVRHTAEGIQEALIELYTLARTRGIMGSAHSSYSETAAQLSGIPCLILRS